MKKKIQQQSAESNASNLDAAVAATDATEKVANPLESNPLEGDPLSLATNSVEAVNSLRDSQPLSAPTNGGRTFDAEIEQQIGIVLGIGLGCVRGRDQDNNVRDHFYLRPGDDVSVAFPNAGTPPKAIDKSFTIVDFYESKMSEYDATFAFVPLRSLQESRGMIDPQTG